MMVITTMTQLTAKLVRNERGDWVLKIDNFKDSESGYLEWSVSETGHSSDDHLTGLHIQKLVIDLSAADHVDSRGTRLLFDAYRQFAPKGTEIVLLNPSAQLHRLLKIMQFNRLFTIETNG